MNTLNRGCEWIEAPDAARAVRAYQQGKAEDPHCNKPQENGSAYCRHHQRIAYILVPKRSAA